MKSFILYKKLLFVFLKTLPKLASTLLFQNISQPEGVPHSRSYLQFLSPSWVCLEHLGLHSDVSKALYEFLCAFSSLGAETCSGFFFFKILFTHFYREGKRERKRGREISMCGCLSSAPHWGPGPQPRHVP